MLKSALCILALGNLAYAIHDDQAVKVTGTLFCNKEVMKIGHLVELFEEDMIGADDLLGKAETSFDGLFEVQGTEAEFGWITPYIKIQHTCLSKCLKTVKLYVPQEFITRNSKTADKVWALGNLDLAEEKNAGKC